jgi:hypothetical protein
MVRVPPSSVADRLIASARMLKASKAWALKTEIGR